MVRATKKEQEKNRHERSKKKNLFKKTNSHLIFFLSIIFTITIFIYLYSNISFSVKDNNLLIFVLTSLKLIFCFLVSGVLLILMTKFKIGPSGMPYNPAYKSGRNPKVKDSIIVKNRYKNANSKTT